jgi:hypothetical protein
VLVGQDRGTDDAGGSLARDGLPNSASVASAAISQLSSAFGIRSEWCCGCGVRRSVTALRKSKKGSDPFIVPKGL